MAAALPALVLTGPSATVLGAAALGGAGDALAGLAPYERSRAEAYVRPSDADDYVAAHLLVRRAAAQVLGVPAQTLTLAQRCDRCGGPHGRPSIVDHPEIAVSLSHTRGHVAAAAGVAPIGVDIEIDRRYPADLVPVVLAAGEVRLVQAAPVPSAAFLGFWVRKEALVKVGRVTLDTMASVDLSGEADRWQELYLTSWTAPGGIIGACAATTTARIEPA